MYKHSLYSSVRRAHQRLVALIGGGLPDPAVVCRVQYEPELFPGLIYRMVEPKIVLLIFVSGKVVLTGGKVRASLVRVLADGAIPVPTSCPTPSGPQRDQRRLPDDLPRAGGVQEEGELRSGGAPNL